MDRRTTLNKNDRLAFPGLECVIDAPAGRGSSVLAYTGYYPDQEDPRIRHRVLIRELFPYDPSGGILRSKENALEIEKRSEVLYTHYRESFLRANEVHSRMAEEIPGELVNLICILTPSPAIIRFTVSWDIPAAEVWRKKSGSCMAKRRPPEVPVLWIFRNWNF